MLIYLFDVLCIQICITIASCMRRARIRNDHALGSSPSAYPQDSFDRLRKQNKQQGERQRRFSRSWEASSKIWRRMMKMLLRLEPHYMFMPILSVGKGIVRNTRNQTYMSVCTLPNMKTHTWHMRTRTPEESIPSFTKWFQISFKGKSYQSSLHASKGLTAFA